MSTILKEVPNKPAATKRAQDPATATLPAFYTDLAVLRMTMSCSRSEVADMEPGTWGERSSRC